MQESQIGEVRGIAPEQNLDPYIGSVVQEKLKEFPDGKQYEKKVRDMKFLTAIENKIKKGIELSKDDLTFIYEINTTIEGFGYQRDPRIAELQASRNTEEDMLIVFECSKEQIAHTPNEIGKNTKAYVGKLEPGIFQKLPENFEHIYTSFPDKKIHRENVEVGGKTANELEHELEKASINISDYARDMLHSPDFNPSKKTESTTLIRLTVADLGFAQNATIDQIYKRAEEIGLELCPAEIGPEYRLKYLNQPMDEWLLIGMKQIADRYGYPDVFRLERRDVGLCLSFLWAKPSHEWFSDFKFVFCLRKVES